MQSQRPKAQRLLIWQITSNSEGFSCSSCSWIFANPDKLTEQEHDAAEVQRRFTEHVCNRELPLKKFKWS